MKATMDLVAENGFHATPMSLIAKQAGVAAGTIYTYFPSKEILIKELYRELKEKMAFSLQLHNEGGTHLRDRFFNVYKNLFHYFTQNTEEFMFLEQYANSPLSHHEQAGDNPSLTDPLEDFLISGRESGIFRNMEIELMSSIMLGQVVAVAKLHLSKRLIMTDSLLEKAAQSCWDAVKIN